MQPTYYDYLQWVEQQRMASQPQMQQPQQLQQPILSYVANRTAADLFNVNPGQEAVLIDMDMPYVYKKARGADGKLLPLEVYDVVPHVEPVVQTPQINLDGYVRYEDIDQIVAKEVEKRITEAFSRSSKKKED